jgi:hypothetical protein
MVKDLDLMETSGATRQEVMEISVVTLLGDMKISEDIHQADMAVILMASEDIHQVDMEILAEISEVIRRGDMVVTPMASEATNQLEDTKTSVDTHQEDMAVTLMASEDMNSEDMVDTNHMDSEDTKAVTEDSTLKLVDMEEAKNIHSVVS